MNGQDFTPSDGADPDPAEPEDVDPYAADPGAVDQCSAGQADAAPEEQQSVPVKAVRRPIRRRPSVGKAAVDDAGAASIDREITQLARSQAEAAIRTLAAIMKSRKGAPTARIAAANALLTRGFGRSTGAAEAKDTRHAEELSDEELVWIARGTAGDRDGEPSHGPSEPSGPPDSDLETGADSAA